MLRRNEGFIEHAAQAGYLSKSRTYVVLNAPGAPRPLRREGGKLVFDMFAVARFFRNRIDRRRKEHRHGKSRRAR